MISHRMKVLSALLAGLLILLPSLSEAYNWVPEVKPVVYKGVIFTAPHLNGTVGIVEAWDFQTGLKVWEKVLYTVTVDPNGYEEDVQWVFIKELSVKDGKVIAVDQHRRQFIEPLPDIEFPLAEDAKIVQIYQEWDEIFVDGVSCGANMENVKRELLSVAKAYPDAFYEVKIDKGSVSSGEIERYRSLLEEVGVVVQHFWVPLSGGGASDTYSRSRDILPDLLMMQGAPRQE